MSLNISWSSPGTVVTVVDQFSISLQCSPILLPPGLELCTPVHIHNVNIFEGCPIAPSRLYLYISVFVYVFAFVFTHAGAHSQYEHLRRLPNITLPVAHITHPRLSIYTAQYLKNIISRELQYLQRWSFWELVNCSAVQFPLQWRGSFWEPPL